MRRVTMAVKIERFQPDGMNVRLSAGRPSYSHVVTVSGSGKIVYIAGQLARDVDGNCVGKGDTRAQMEQTFQNLVVKNRRMVPGAMDRFGWRLCENAAPGHSHATLHESPDPGRRKD